MFFNMVKVRVIKYVLIEDANNLSRMKDKINVSHECHFDNLKYLFVLFL